MAKRIIKDREIVEDQWTTLADDAPVPERGDVIVSLERWRSEREALTARKQGVGVSVNGEHDIRSLADDLEGLSLIALEFPAFADGRCYSHARILRDQLGYKGELRATGDILRDQIFYMQRVGINAFDVSETQAIEDVLQGLQDFSVTYQAAADVSTPLYRRRA
ncbi:MAG: hypothetical protein ACJAYU_002317 [Bradymonadia bacterium]|jgi:uncharacterized protein (DUF934 family)